MQFHIYIRHESDQHRSYAYIIDIPEMLNESDYEEYVKQFLYDNKIYLDESDIDNILTCISYDDLIEGAGSHGDFMKKRIEERIYLAEWKYFNEEQNPFYNNKYVTFLGYIN